MELEEGAVVTRVARKSKGVAPGKGVRSESGKTYRILGRHLACLELSCLVCLKVEAWREG